MYSMLAATPVIVSGTEDLISDAMVWLIAISSGACALSVIYNLVKRYFADENDNTNYKKRIKRNLFIGIAVVCTEAIVTLVLSYYS